MRVTRRRHAGPMSGVRVVGTIVLGTLLLVGYVSLRVWILVLETQVYELQNRQAVIGREIDRLRMESAELAVGERIKTIATSQLGMVEPSGVPEKLF